jgi:hypothetical protein
VGPRTGLDGCRKLSLTEIRSPDLPARSQSSFYVTALNVNREGQRSTVLQCIARVFQFILQYCATMQETVL